ncbi:MAG: FG-GAP-like repeat-containing protein [Phycisphaerales bacterium JB064]
MLTASVRAAMLRVVAGGVVGLAGPSAMGDEVSGPFTVEINDLGVLTASMGGPLRTHDGDIFELAGATGAAVTEWSGYQYMVGGQVRRYVASGVEADWLNRPAVEAVSSTFTPGRAVTVTRTPELEIRTEAFFDGSELIVSTVFTNTTSDRVRGLFFSRECRTMGTTDKTFPDDWSQEVPAAPTGVSRRLWMLDDILPGASAQVTWSYTDAPAVDGPNGPDVDVPLSLWTSAAFPSGLIYGNTNGISWGDYDADGWPDVFACQGGELWRNLEGNGWQMVDDLDRLLPSTSRRYGSSFGDYNNDGLPDIGTEPRNFPGDTCMHLLRADGLLQFTNVMLDRSLVDVQPCQAHAETICWADVDADDDLDMVLPVYPAWAFGNHGNYFFENKGPVGPGGQYVLDEDTAATGFGNPPPASARSEGAQFVDVDFDGDLDWYCNGHLYQNNSTPGDPSFDFMAELASGIRFSTSLEEGIAFLDYDLDGDYDMIAIYTGPGIKLWENRGDGTYFERTGAIDSPLTGLDLGISVVDWDNDGDMDFTSRSVFRRNQLMETGVARYTVATTDIPSSHRSSATPAYADWDRDGDLDCALGNWLERGRFYENTTYDASTPEEQKRYIRVRAMTDDDAIERGLETQYGANVILDIAGDSVTRMKFQTSSAGYLNQDEYPVHLALPADPFPGDPTRDLAVSIIVDFPGLPELGYRRVDRNVNSALGEIDIATLSDREIVVFRSGIVVIDGESFEPDGDPNVMFTAGRELVQADPASGMSRPTPVGSPAFVGVGFDTDGAAGPKRMTQIIIDGQLRAASDCLGESANVVFWDVTDAPTVAARWDLSTNPDNDRAHFNVDAVLQPDRAYRLVADVLSTRQSLLFDPTTVDGVTVDGGLLAFSSACNGDAVAATGTVPGLFMTFRFRDAVGGCRADFDGSGSLDLFDFLAFQNAFGLGDLAADFDGDGVLTLFDFLEFQNAFDAGC